MKASADAEHVAQDHVKGKHQDNDRGSDKGKGKVKGNGKCFNCGSDQHYADDCPEPRRPRQGGNGGNGGKGGRTRKTRK